MSSDPNCKNPVHAPAQNYTTLKSGSISLILYFCKPTNGAKLKKEICQTFLLQTFSTLEAQYPELLLKASLHK